MPRIRDLKDQQLYRVNRLSDYGVFTLLLTKAADLIEALSAGVSRSSKLNLPGYVGFFQFLRNFRQQNAFEQAELILRAALDHAIARRAKKESLSRALITLIFYKLR
jgi:hypothetical protein